MGATCWGWSLFLCSPASQDNLSARTAAVAADVHIAIKLALPVATAIAVLALVTCDFGIEQRQPHLQRCRFGSHVLYLTTTHH